MSLTVWFGYEVEIPSTKLSIEETILEWYDMNEVIPSPFRVCSLVSAEDRQDARIIIGFPVGSLEEVMEMADELKDWMRDNPLFYDIDYNRVPGFYGGFEWCPTEDSMEVDSNLETESTSETDADSENDYESESDSEC